jgi:hypothetical protein
MTGTLKRLKVEGQALGHWFGELKMIDAGNDLRRAEMVALDKQRPCCIVFGWVLCSTLCARIV